MTRPEESAGEPWPFRRRFLIACAAGGLAGLAVGGVLRSRNAPEPAPPEPAPIADADAVPSALARPDAGPPPAAEPTGPVAIAWDGLPDYPNAKATPLGEDVQAQGVRMAVGFFETTDGVDEVLNFYEKEFRRREEAYVRQVYGDGVGFTGYMDADDHVMRVVTAVPATGRTMVFLSKGGSIEGFSATAEVPREVPLPDSAVGTTVVAVGEKSNDRTVMTRVPDTTLTELSSFYRRAFIERGWRVVRESRPTIASWTLDVSRPGALAQVSLVRPLDDSRVQGIQAFVRLTQGDGAGVAAVLEEER